MKNQKSTSPDTFIKWKRNNRIIINYDGRHRDVEHEGMIYLVKGYYPFKLEYFQVGGGQTLKLSRLVKSGNNTQKLEFVSKTFWHGE